MSETWKDIKGYPGYQVSDLGEIRTYNKVTFTKCHGMRRWKNRILKQRVSKDGSHRVSLWNNGREKSMLVHRLVANAFCGEMLDSGLTVNHIDGNRQNNTASNLEWMTISDNIKYGFTHGQFDNVKRKCKLVANDGQEVEFESLRDADRYLGKKSGYAHERSRNNKPCRDQSGATYKIVVLSDEQ